MKRQTEFLKPGLGEFDPSDGSSLEALRGSATSEHVYKKGKSREADLFPVGNYWNTNELDDPPKERDKAGLGKDRPSALDLLRQMEKARKGKRSAQEDVASDHQLEDQVYWRLHRVVQEFVRENKLRWKSDGAPRRCSGALHSLAELLGASLARG